MTTASFRRPPNGPLAPYHASYKEALSEKGYARSSITTQLQLMTRLDRWLGERGLTQVDLTPDRVKAFLQGRRRADRNVGPLLRHLRALGVVPPPTPPIPATPMDHLMGRYRAYLTNERGLATGTIYQYEFGARLFLDEVADLSELALDGLNARDVMRFVVRQCSGNRPGRSQMLVRTLRSLLRFLFVEGLIRVELAPAVPAVASWRGAGLPKAIPPEQVAALLRSCDRRHPLGLRDFAILTLLVRLGLRVVEVAVLRLTDVDWRAGEIVIRGKGRRDERLPVPNDVGEALVAYLRGGRPDSKSRRFFLRIRAPHDELTSHTVRGIVRQAFRHAGLTPVGAHRLRHTVATEMLRGGARLSEIGQVLRHRTASSTAIYAKVDREALRPLAQAWPGGAA